MYHLSKSIFQNQYLWWFFKVVLCLPPFLNICFRESNYYYPMGKISKFIWYATILYVYLTHRMFLQKLFYPIRKSYDVIHSIYVYCPDRWNLNHTLGSAESKDGILARASYRARRLTLVKFIYSKKATKFCEISTVDLSYVVPVKSMVAFSEYMNFT